MSVTLSAPDGEDAGIHVYDETPGDTLSSKYTLTADGVQNPKQPGENPEREVRAKKLTLKAEYQKIAAGKKVKLSVSVFPEHTSNPAVEWRSGSIHGRNKQKGENKA